MVEKIVYGLDLGINNVGWAAIRKGASEVDILACGTFVFDAPLQDENKPSEGLKSKLRGLKRRARRTTNRRHHRKMRLYRLLAEHGLLPSSIKERVPLFCSEPNPYKLRAQGLTNHLEPFEFGRVLAHLNQRRGFLSPRDLMLFGIDRFEDGDTQDVDEETGKMLSEIRSTREAMDAFETVGAFLFQRVSQGLPVRKKMLKKKTRGPDGKIKKVPASPKEQREEDERRFVRADRHMIKAEFDLLWQRQAQYHSILTPQLKEQVEQIIFFQNNLSADPATRRKCRFHPDELALPRAGLLAQKYDIAQMVANLSVAIDPSAPNPEGGLFSTADEVAEWEAKTTPRKLLGEERRELLRRLMDGRSLSWSEVKEALGLPTTAVFNIEPTSYTIMSGGKKKTIRQTSGTKKELRGSQTVERLRQILGEKWDQLDERAKRELVGEIVSIRDWVGFVRDRPAALRRRQLFQSKSYGPNQVRFTDREANALATVQLPEGYLSIGRTAARRLMPHLLRDKVYSEACTAVGYDHANPEGDLPVLDRLPYPTEKDIPHAVVRTSVASAVRVLNALHREFGKPDAIHIELPRDLAMGAKQREEEEKRIQANEKARKEIAKRLVAIGIRPTGSNIRRVQLWEELGGAGLAMEPDVVISDLRDLFEGGYDIGHIVPRGHSLDNSMGNLFLCTEHFNRQLQGNRTPFEALGHTEAWPRIVAHVNALKSMPLRKRQRLLAKERPEDFTGRHLAATGWISREVLKLAQQMVEHKPNALVVPGQASSRFRSFWDLEGLVPLHPEEEAKVREWTEFLARAEAGEATEEDVNTIKKPDEKTRSNFLHHTVDAIVVALADRAALQAMARFYQALDSGDPFAADRDRRREARMRALPDPNIRQKAQQALGQAEIVHRPRRRPGGPLHKEMPDKDVVHGIPPSEPWARRVVGKHLIVNDHEGKPAQAYPLENNHHVVIWERTQPNRKGEYERAAEVVPMIEAVRRRDAKEPVIRKTRPEPGWRYVMSLCKGDMVEMTDGTIGVVSKFNPQKKESEADIAIWFPFVAQQLGKINKENRYLLARISTAGRLRELRSRVVLDPLGRIVYREGGRE